MKLISHSTIYSYSEDVSLSFHRALQTPRETVSQRVTQTRLVIDPPAAESVALVDYFGNSVTQFSITQPHRRLRVEAETVLESSPAPIPPPETPPWENVVERLSFPASREDLTASEFRFDSQFAPTSPAAREFALNVFTPGRPLIEATAGLNHRVFSEFRYDPAVTEISTPVDEVLAARHGVCQDFAHLAIAALRSIGLAARYVSGYLVPGPDVVGAQASHAWLAVYVPGSGWVDFDPTNDLSPTDGHITVAWGRDFGDVSPLGGVVVGGGKHFLTVSVDVR